MQVLAGGAGAVTPKISKSMDKFFGKTFDEIDEAVATGEIDAGDEEIHREGKLLGMLQSQEVY